MKPAPFKHTVYNALVVPRPIGWITTMSSDGVINLAPYSFFNSLSADPPCVMYCPNYFKPGTEELKDSLTNVEETGEFVYNMCTADLRDEMIISSKHSPRSFD
ncbi:MAG: flavin reductase family protein, partial [Hyphomicrobiaceae bacterium]